MHISLRVRRRCRRWDRYIARCNKISGGRHVVFGPEKRYTWMVKQEYAHMWRRRS